MIKEYIYSKVEECLFRAKFNKAFDHFYKLQNIEELFNSPVLINKFDEIFIYYANVEHKGRISELLMRNEERIRHAYLKQKIQKRLKSDFIKNNSKLDDYELLKKHIAANLNFQVENLTSEKINHEDVGNYIEFILKQ